MFSNTLFFHKTSILWWVDPGWMLGAHQSHSITPPPQLDRGQKKYEKRLMGRDKDREGSFTYYCHQKNRLDIGKLVQFVINQIQVG